MSFVLPQSGEDAPWESLPPELKLVAKAIARHERRHKKLYKRKNFKRRVFEEFGGLCPYCLIPMRLHTHNVENVRGSVATVDHVIPKARNGSNDHSNLLIVCARCNRDKGDRSLIEFLSSSKTKRRLSFNSKLPVLTELEKKYT